MLRRTWNFEKFHIPDEYKVRILEHLKRSHHFFFLRKRLTPFIYSFEKKKRYIYISLSRAVVLIDTWNKRALIFLANAPSIRMRHSPGGGESGSTIDHTSSRQRSFVPVRAIIPMIANRSFPTLPKCVSKMFYLPYPPKLSPVKTNLYLLEPL